MKDIKDKKGKIVLTKEIQEEMLQFFLKTSIPRNKRNKKTLSEKKADR
jgi:hypothetical protein